MEEKLKRLLEKKELNDFDIEDLKECPQVMGVEFLKPGDKWYKKENQLIITVMKNDDYDLHFADYVKLKPLVDRLEINGVVSSEEGTDFDEDKFVNELTEFLESKGLYFGGGFTSF